MEKLFDTIHPSVLFDAVLSTNFPPIDAVMGLQMHMAPRAIMVATLASDMIRVDLSILAGCIYSIPFVKALMHEGSTICYAFSKNLVHM